MQRAEKAVHIPKLRGDKQRLQQVLINLLKNATKFTREGQINILVSFNRYENMLIVSVLDTGVGITKEQFPKLFTRFGKQHRTSRQNSEGIGLGLTIAK